MKSSAASILITPGLDGLEAMPIKPSGDPVLKLNGEVACALGMDAEPEKTIPTNNSRRIIGAADDTKVRFMSLKLYLQMTLSLQEPNLIRMNLKFRHGRHDLPARASVVAAKRDLFYL
jgi:hypothetical protein